MKDFSKLIKTLEHLGYTVREFSTAKEASLYLTEAIQNCHVGFGGSKTLEAMGLFDLLSEKMRFTGTGFRRITLAGQKH